ncbi:MAG: glutamine-hydrolyzing carbamoyl-phosphate synthase small subunit, partial [Planctomycetia bacterium]
MPQFLDLVTRGTLWAAGKLQDDGTPVAELAVAPAAAVCGTSGSDGRLLSCGRVRQDHTPEERRGVARAALALEDGSVYFGDSFGATGTVSGEVCFNTSMTGYQEILTDPSYRGQILTMTTPQIGNYGVNEADVESGKLQMAGFIVREASRIASNFTATGTLGDYLARAGVVGLAGIDTRALVRRLRIRGAMTGVLSSAVLDPAKLVEMARAAPTLVGRDLVREVMPESKSGWTESLDAWARPLPPPLAGGVVPPPPAAAVGEKHVVALDYGMKWNIARHLASAGCRVTVLPGRATAAEVLALSPDGVFLSNGPGDPEVLGYCVDTVRDLVGKVPMFGICLGHQLLSLACGAKTFKLKFGHRGANQPVMDLETGKVEITSQNHGFAVDEATLPPELVVTHRNLNDGTIEGVRHTTAK